MSHRRFGKLKLVDVGTAADITLELAALESRPAYRPHPPVLAIAPEETELSFKAVPAGNGFMEGINVITAVFGMDELRPLIAKHFHLVHTEKFQILAIDEYAAGQAGDPDQHRRVIGKSREQSVSGLSILSPAVTDAICGGLGGRLLRNFFQLLLSFSRNPFFVHYYYLLVFHDSQPMRTVIAAPMLLDPVHRFTRSTVQLQKSC